MTVPMTVPMLWPATLPIDDPSFHLDNISRSGGPSISGREQVVASMSSRWTAKFSAVVGTRQEIGCYRALLASLRGRANPILLSPCEPGLSPAVLAGGNAMVATTHSDGTGFSDGTGYLQDGTLAYLFNAQSALDGAVDVYCSHVPQVGSFFSIDDPLSGDYRLHMITSMAGPKGSPWSSGFSPGFGPGVPGTVGVYSFGIEPPLRRDYPIGQRLSFGRPLCRMRMVDDGSGAMSRSKVAYATPSLSFVEVF